VGAVLLGEMIDPRHRGKALGAVQSGAPIGSGIAALLAGPVAASFDPDLGWRIAFWIGLAPALLIFFIRRGSDDAEIYKRSLERQRAENRRTGLSAIFARPLLGITLLASLLSLGVQGAAYSVANYLTTFMTTERGLAQSVAGYLVLVNSAGGFFGCITNSYISDLFGRRTVFRLFGFGFLVMASIYLFGPWGANLWLLVPIGMVYGFFQFGMYASFGPYFTELFPTELRGSGQAFAYNSGRAGAALFITGVPLLAALMPLSAAMATLGIVGIICALLATLLLPETVGRALPSLADPDSSGADDR
jgi:MFS family permease